MTPSSLRQYYNLNKNKAEQFFFQQICITFAKALKKHQNNYGRLSRGK